MQDKIERILLDIELKNEDLLDLSSHLPQQVNVSYDLKSLVKSEFVYDIDPDLLNMSISAEDFLEIQRRRAEQKLIKTKIIYKLYHANQELTVNEKKYLNQWMQLVRQD